ncbi:uncharacterized protein LACBIDRAFT_323152 [Laccaria bicolor S238N-H82]|uniref:3-oxoacyl-[acyl-carrier-protein] reductase n=1 Tax=Laccaria bicolor (strain S238N-H82 / ATCC MYA-4686) TaxID=486041 RepID=B0CZA2_LACBS|nr:uncharacterized protein LACBIDRAFT_323152 [Laccaria bicolor S238N-H82]EDR12117.1 predicted protein [Laccaria bicolor S238N-H82]|eukprot:XP_001876381.1 predicted protein [Laccaria bicolor S238N-H82]
MSAPAPITHFTGTQVAIVTGAAQGIGRAIALRLAEDGLDICVDDLPSKIDLLNEVVAEIKQLGRKAIALPCDVTKEQEVKDLVEKTVAQLGRLDVMVANAGIAFPSSIMEANIDQWESIWAVNMRGPVLCYKYSAIQMAKQNSGGRIIGKKATNIRRFDSNAKITSFYRCLVNLRIARLRQSRSILHVKGISSFVNPDSIKYGITVNAYAPGIIETEMTTHPLDKDLGEPCAALKRTMNIPHAKVGQPEQVASLVSYLASPESHFLTGQTISVNGGVVFN